MAINYKSHLWASLGDYELDFEIEGHLVPWSPNYGGLFAPFSDTSNPNEVVSLLPISVETTVTSLSNGDSEVLRSFVLERSDFTVRSLRKSIPDKKSARPKGDLLIATDFSRFRNGNYEFIADLDDVLLEWGLGTRFNFEDESTTPNQASYEINQTFDMIVEHLYEV